MMKKLTSAALTLGLAAVAAGPAIAHHSFAMYDSAHLLVLTGAIESFTWSNPHSLVLLLGSPNGGAKPVLWTLEMTSPGNLTRMGWSRGALKPGDKVEVTVAPLLSGATGGALLRAKIIATGQTFSAIPPEAPKTP